MDVNILTVPLKVCTALALCTIGLLTYRVYQAVIDKKRIAGKRDDSGNSECVHRTGELLRSSESCTCTGVISGVVVSMSDRDKFKLFHTQGNTQLEDAVLVRLTGIDTSENPSTDARINMLLTIVKSEKALPSRSNSAASGAVTITSDCGSFTLPSIHADNLDDTYFNERLPGFDIFNKAKTECTDNNGIITNHTNANQWLDPPSNISLPVSVIPDNRSSAFPDHKFDAPKYGQLNKSFPKKLSTFETPILIPSSKFLIYKDKLLPPNFASVNPHRCYPQLKNSLNERLGNNGNILDDGTHLIPTPTNTNSTIPGECPLSDFDRNIQNDAELLEDRNLRLESLTTFSSDFLSNASNQRTGNQSDNAPGAVMTVEDMPETFNPVPSARPRKSLVPSSGHVSPNTYSRALHGFENVQENPSHFEFKIMSPTAEENPVQSINKETIDQLGKDISTAVSPTISADLWVKPIGLAGSVQREKLANSFEIDENLNWKLPRVYMPLVSQTSIAEPLQIEIPENNATVYSTTIPGVSSEGAHKTLKMLPALASRSEEEISINIDVQREAYMDSDSHVTSGHAMEWFSNDTTSSSDSSQSRLSAQDCLMNNFVQTRQDVASDTHGYDLVGGNELQHPVKLPSSAANNELPDGPLRKRAADDEESNLDGPKNLISSPVHKTIDSNADALRSVLMSRRKSRRIRPASEESHFSQENPRP